MALNELQQAAKELGLYNKNTAKKQKKKREERHNYWVNKTNGNNSNLNYDNNDYVNIQKGFSYYGNNLSRSQVKTYLSDLQSNSMAAVKDPDYSSKIKYLSDYSLNFGYKDKKYADEYLKELNNKIQWLENPDNGADIEKYLKTQPNPNNEDVAFQFKKQLDELKSKKASFEAQREVYKRTTFYEDNYKKLESEKDYNSFSKKGAFEEHGFKNKSTDKSNDKFAFLHYEDAETNYSDELETYRLKEAFSPVSVYGLDIYLHDNERKTYNYLLGKYGEKSANEYFNSMERTLNIRKNNYANKAHENFAENADTKAKVVENVGTALIKPVGVLSSGTANLKGAIDGKVDPYDSYHQISNTANKVTEYEAQHIKNSFDNEFIGDRLSNAYQAGRSIVDMGINTGIAIMTGGGSVVSGILFGLDSANSYLQTAYDRGLSQEQMYSGAVLTGLAEGFFEKYSLDKIIKMKPGGVKQIFINTLKSAGIEASEEAATEIADIIIDNAVALENSENTLEKNRLMREEGLDEKEAERKVFVNNISSVVSSAEGGFLAGLGFGGISNTIQYKNNKSIVNSESAQNFGKNALISDNQQEIINTAKELGINTKKAEFSLNNLNETAKITEQSPNETNQAAYDEAFKTASKEIAELELYIEQSKKDNIKTSKNDTKSFLRKFLNKGNNTQSAVEAVETVENDSLDTNGAFVDDTESNINTGNSVDENTDSTNFAVNKVIRDNKLAKIKQTAKSETAVNDLTEHIDDQFYKIVYNETVNIEDNLKDTSASAQVGATPSVSGADSSLKEGAFSVEERSAEFNRIYDMGTDEDILPHEIESDIFTPEQVRRIYAAAVIDDNKRNNYSEQVNFTELLKEYEDKAAIAQFGNETVKNIMTASAEQVRSSAKKLGINVEFVNKVPGKNPNADGAYNPKTNTIYINNNTKYPMQQVFLHELTHFFESADNYSEFQNTVFKSRAFKKWLGKYTNIKKDKYKSIDEYRNALKERYGEKDDTKINREMVAFFVSDNLFQKDFGDLGRLATELTGSKKERFISFIKNIFKRFKNAVSGIDKLEKKFLSLYRTAGQNKNTDNNNGVKYEINTNFANDIKTWDRNGKSDEESFILGSTGDVLQGLGARENDIYINGSKINTILRDHPEMSLDVIKKIPEILENPILVLSSKNKVKNNTRMVMFGRINAENGKPVLCVLDLIPKENKIVLDDMQKAVSAYSKTNGSEDIKSFFERSEVLYASKNKKITTNLIGRVGFFMPTELRHSGYIGSITYDKRNVKIKGKPFNEVFSYDTNNSISENAEDDTDIPQMNTGEETENEIVDRYTEKQYNNFGWIAVNQVLTKNEWSQYNNKLRETLSSKIPRNINGEHVMTVGEHSSDITALVYVKGTAVNPIVTKVVRVNKNISNTENISVILEELADYERQGYREPYSYVESIYEQKIFNVNQRKDFKSLSEVQVERKGNFGVENQKNYRIKRNGAGSTNTNNEIEAGLNKSAFSIGEESKDVFGFNINSNADVNEDLLEELSIYDKNAEVDRNGNVTVYHRTTAENAQQILNTGIMKAKEDALFFSSQPKGYASDYGDTVVKLKIPSNKLLVNDIFDGEVHFEIPLQYRNGSFKLNVSQYIDNDNANDIRYMLSEEDKFDSFGNYFDEDENGEVTFISADQYQDELKKNPKIGVLDKQQIELKAKSLLKKYQSRINSADVASQLNAIYNDIKNIDENGNHARPKVEKLANDIYDNIVEKVSNGEVYEQLKDILQGSKMLWTDEVKTAFGDDWNDFIRKNRHRLNLIKADSGKNGIGIDVMYDNLCRELPGFFDGNAQGPKAQLNEMLDVLNGQQFVYDTFLDDNKEDIINQIISDIYGGFAQIDYIKKGSDKAKAQTDYKFDNQYLDEYGIDDKRFKADMRKQINEKSADFVKEQKRRYKDGEISASQFADSLTEHFARVSLTAKIKPLESYYRQSDKYRQRFRQINERTTKNLKELRSMLQNPTEGKYIPADLVDLVQDVLNIGDNQNFNLRDKLKRYRDTLSRADIDEGILDVYKQAIDKCEDELNKQNLGQVFAEIHRKYNSYKTGKAENTQAGEFEQSFYCYHEAVAQKLEQVAATLENADMTRLTMRQAEALDEGLNCLTHFVKNSVKAIGLTESAHIAEVGHDMIQETKATAVHKNFASKMLNTAINAELSPERMFRRMGGYKADSMWVKMADMLTEGQTQAEVIKQRLKDVIAPALNGENMKNAENARSYKNKDLVDIGLVDENGESVKVPHAFMISAYLHLQNEANQNHALKGGFEIPDFRTYYKGKISKSFTEGKIKARFTDVTSALKKLEQNMSEYDKLVAKNVALLFDTHTKAEYNKINMDVFGFEKAKVKHYFPIYSSNDFIATGFDTSYEASLKNQGNMKSRIEGAVNPIKLMDVFDVVDKEISRCGEYCGKLKAEITMTRVYNTTTAEFGTSLKEQVGLHFGESGKKYIEHLMQDYSGTRKTENSVALSKLRGAVATSALMGNINVAMKQAGSYPTAAATIGWKPLLKALAVSDEGAKVFYRANRQLIDKYTPWLRYRTEGYSTQEIADLKNLSFYNKRQMKWLFGWINASDIATVGRLWQAAQYYVDDNNTELKKGTDEYYKQVAKVFNKIIFDTQPNYTVMQRPDILRNPNSLLKSMIMFSTQPLQNLGILYDSAMNYNAQLKAFKQGKVDKSVLQEAKRGLARGISSIVVSAGVISLMTLLAKALTGRMDDYLDKYGEFNAVGILKGSLKVFSSTLAGMVTFGSEIYNFIMSAVTGDTYYGVNISSIDLISDVFESFINEITAVKNQKDILNKTVAFVEKSSALFGFPARNLKNLFGGVTNLISTGDWFALNEKKTDSQYYAQMYDCCINGENEKYNKLYNELLERGKTVNEIEGGIKTCLKEAESDDIKEAAQALIDGDNKIYNDIINEFISRGFDEKIVLETVDEVADKLKGDELTDDQKKTKEKSKYTYMQNLLNKIDFSGLSSKQKAEAQQEVEKMADEYGYQAATGEPKNATYDNAIKSDKAGVVPAKDFVIAKTLLQKKYADADGDGNVSAQEKYDAIQKSNIPSDIKKLLQAMNIMGSKKIDTDNDGKTETAFDDLSAKEQKEYINKNNSDILKILEDTNASAEKSEIKANYRAKLESKINVFDYKEKYRSDVQNEIDYLSSAAADIDINGDTDSSTAKAVLSFDESGFIDIADYVKFYVNAKKYTKNEEKLEVINQLDISDNAKLRLKLWTVASGWSLDSDGDGKRDKRISTYSPEFQEKWIKENAGYIQSNCSYWR